VKQTTLNPILSFFALPAESKKRTCEVRYNAFASVQPPHVLLLFSPRLSLQWEWNTVASRPTTAWQENVSGGGTGMQRVSQVGQKKLLWQRLN